MAERGFAKETTIHESYDGKTKIKQFLRVKIATDNNNNTARSGKRTTLSHPSLIAGFPGTGLVGSISANFIIERLGMHQIAAVDSEFIMPTVTYIGNKLRHPFRIYADKKGSLYVIVCEAPLMPEGVHNIMDLVVSWAINNGIGKVITLDGMPVAGLPGKEREPIILTSHYSPDGQQQYPSLPSLKQSNNDNGNNSGNSNNSTAGKDGDGQKTLPSWRYKKTALITGMSAGLLSSCLSHDMACSAVLVQTSSGVPDPEGAALLLQTISEMPNVPLKLDVDPLLKEGKEIKRRLAETIASLRQQEEELAPPHPVGRSMMYG
ncbi:MAG TPA: PAC2 family protein [Nitrososphaera sp.]|nr:PAC2 family protein [Nitrososphaera sp.]